MFDSINEPITLSQLLARAEQIASTVDDQDQEPLDRHLLASAMVHAAYRAWATHLAGRSAGDRVVIAVTTGRALDTDDVRADDLVLVPGEVTEDINAPAEPSRLHRPVHHRDDDEQELTG